MKKYKDFITEAQPIPNYKEWSALKRGAKISVNGKEKIFDQLVDNTIYYYRSGDKGTTDYTTITFGDVKIL